MLISLLALLAMTVSAGIRSMLGDAPVVLENPSTLELAVIGGGVFAVYALASRRIGRQRAKIERISIAEQLARPAKSTQAEKPSRGAA